MNIFEVGKKENIGKEYNVYRQGICIGKWTMMRIETSNEFEFYNKKDERMTDLYYISQILGMKFEEVIDWAEVPVNTMIWVRESEEYDWLPRHFAKYEDGKVLAWNDGKTSFTATCEGETTSWDYVKLYQK
jgi:hypothetical protein